MATVGVDTAVQKDECISEDAILAFLAGELEGEILLEIGRHLDRCGGCRRVVGVAGAHVRSMVRNDSRATSTFAVKTDSSALLRSLRPVDEVDYVVERELARGGMGRILLATDRQGRRVALKVLLESSERATRRFVREMQVTARLQHPSIITLYEAGRWPSGEPFFAMKLVPGRSLRDELAGLPALKDRLALVPRLIAVTDALAYAHDQGIIHRDLKPGNILIGEFGETVVIDWGLAKVRGLTDDEKDDATDEPSAAMTQPGHGDDTTRVGTLIGTPAYMAPEQVRGDVVDERADVYGLGALLYHVLSGHAPYSGISGRDVLAHALSGPPIPLAERMPDLPTDLVTIVRKAMMPHAADRYATAKNMAEDLRRFSAGQLVSVHAYSFRALVLRWARKNRAAVSVAAALTAMGAVAAWLSIDRIIEERNRAEAERVIATTHHTAAEGLVKFLITEFRDRVIRADRLDLVEGLGDHVSRYYRNIEQSGIPLDATTLSNRATTLMALGNLEFERRHSSKARVLYERALEFWKLADRGSATMVVDLLQYGKTWQYYGVLEHVEGHADAAVEAHQRAIDLADRVIILDPKHLEGHLLGARNWGRICDTLQARKGDLKGSFAACSRAIARLDPLLVKHPNDVELLRSLASLNQTTSDRYLALGDLDEAAASIRKSGQLYFQIVSTEPSNLILAREYAYTFIFRAAVEVARGRLEDAITAVNDSIRRYEDIVREDRGNRASEEDLGVGYAYRCDFERRGLRLEDAKRSCGRALAIFRGHQQSESTAKTRSMTMMVLTNLGRVELAAHRSGLARETLDEAVKIARSLTESDPRSGKWKEDLLISLTWLVDSELKLERYDLAAQHLREAIAIGEGLSRESPENSDIQNSLGRVRILAGNAAWAERRPEAAASFYEGARQTFEQLMRRSPQMVDFQTGFAAACAQLARTLGATEWVQREELRQLREVARGILERLHREGRLYPEEEAIPGWKRPESQPKPPRAAGG